jgi:hypothetical protein
MTRVKFISGIDVDHLQQDVDAFLAKFDTEGDPLEGSTLTYVHITFDSCHNHPIAALIYDDVSQY